MAKHVKNISDFLLEKRLYIFQRKFRIDDLISYQLYSPATISRWMNKYDFDLLAHALFVTTEKIKTGDSIIGDIRISSKDISNKFYFNDEVKKYNGVLIEDSHLKINENDVYLFVFTKNSNKNHRARQIQGFIYEGNIKRLNNLQKLKYTDKWDAEGNLDLRFLESRIPNQVDFFDGDKYTPLNVPDDITGSPEIRWEKLNNDFKKYLHWNIKYIKNGSSVDMGDFKRISGIQFDGNHLTKLNDRVKDFMFDVGFHDESGNTTEEYLILISISDWKTYLPDLTDPNVFQGIQSMYRNLKNFKLVGDRTIDSEILWKKYVNKYSSITSNSVVKLRFKRDSKGQLRIQASINNSDFKRELLKNPHIKIYK